ncbi:MAG: alpha/beta hydrolase, partial [Chthoniobacterales bacterium]
SAQPAPVVMWMFGGSWKFGSRGYHLNIRNLTRAGIAVAAIDYRLSSEALYPAQLQDCQSALRWLRENGARYGIDPTRIGAAGESSGGHLAALLGTVEGRPRIRAVCALYPPTDLVAIGREYADANPSDIERLLGGPIEERLALAREASPINHVNKNSPPFLLIHGAQDTLVPISHSQRLAQRLRENGVAVKLITVPDKGHWFLLDAAQSGEVAHFFQHYLDVAQ